MVESSQYVAILVAAALAALISYLVARSIYSSRLVRLLSAKDTEMARLAESHRSKLDKAVVAERQQHQRLMEQTEQLFHERLDEQARSELSVTVYPFVNTRIEKSFLSRETLVEVGYKYQLLVRGLPCFDPHTVVVESKREKEVNEEMVEILKSKALQFAEAAIEAKTGGIPGKVISLAKTTVSRLK
jgi:hypothetical protein